MGVQLNIKNEEAAAMARQIAAATGVSVTEAVAVALRERVRALQRQDQISSGLLAERESSFYDLVEGLRGRWKDTDPSSDYNDIPYDEYGAPR